MEKFAKVKEKFDKDGIVQVPDILSSSYVQKVSDYYYDLGDEEWNFVWMKDGEVRTLFPGESSKAEIYNARYTELDEVDAFGYHYYRKDRTEVSENFVENVVHNENFKKLIYNITGVEYSRYSYFSSKYISGDYNGWHHDEGNGELAMVFHLTPRWSPHWGGLTHYWKRGDNMADWGNLNTAFKCVDVCCPVFNSMLLMDVRKETMSSHMVSHVNPGLPYTRITLSGWLEE